MTMAHANRMLDLSSMEDLLQNIGEPMAKRKAVHCPAGDCAALCREGVSEMRDGPGRPAGVPDRGAFAAGAAVPASAQG